MRRVRREGRADEVAAECAAFLTANLVEHWEADGRAIPIWAWTNLLAPGSKELIAQSISRPSRHRLLARSWWIARAQLADLLLNLICGSCSLSELQHSVLIPLELELASLPEMSFWNHHQWVDAVSDALHHYDHTRQSS
jgi:hypothetical protein